MIASPQNANKSSCLTRNSIWYTEHRVLKATAMSIDWSGQWILLAGRRHLALQRLDPLSDDDNLRKFNRNSKHEVTAAEWSICNHSQEYCAIATSQLIEVVTWQSGDPTLIHSLRAHTRVITDIDWHSKEPHLLASCSVDTFTHLWDLRDPRKPMMSLSAVCTSGATQVGFNRVSGNLLATAHDGDLRIWDQRKGSCPIQYITAHLARIHGINWSHQHETHLTTASQDGTVKYFDINNPRRAEKIITTASPVWRARYTPFYDGLVTVVVPHLGRGENSVLLWNNTNQTEPVCSFVGHVDVVLDFAWRPTRNNNSFTDLITWSKDQTLRAWRFDENLKRLCQPMERKLDECSPNSSSNNMAGTEMSRSKGLKSPNQPSCSLQHEFSLLNTNIPHINVDTLDPVKRIATVKLSANGHVIMLQATFPIDYPNENSMPEFCYCPGTSLDNNASETLMKVLQDCAFQRIRKGRTCFEQCLRALVNSLKKVTTGGMKANICLQSPRLEGALSSALHDACVPFPKTSGARFGHVGKLVVFCQPINTKRISFRHQNTTPRALSALSSGYLGNVMGSEPVVYAHRDSNVSNFYMTDSTRKSSRNRLSQTKKNPVSVNIYEIPSITVKQELSMYYAIDTANMKDMCKHNQGIAEEFGTPDAVQCWKLALLVASHCEGIDLGNDAISNQVPFVKSLLESLILHAAKNHDIITAAMLCCAFNRYWYKELKNSSLNKSLLQSPNGSPYHTILPIDSKTNPIWNVVSQLKHFRSNSWSESFDDCRIPDIEPIRCTLPPAQKIFYNNLKRFYADILSRWGLITAKTKVLKFTTPIGNWDTMKSVDFVTECSKCSRPISASACENCRINLLYCVICRLPVKGTANACLYCGHGGHTVHIWSWFQTHDTCPTGCGCFCLELFKLLKH